MQKTILELGNIPPLAKSLHEYHDSLNELGIEEFAFMRVEGIGLREECWIYFMPEHEVYAYLTLFAGKYIAHFSSYFEEGFLLTTYYNWNGAITESSKLLEARVETSLQAALDYHLHQTQKYLLQKGQLLRFHTMEEQLNWEKLQNISGAETMAILVGFMKGFARWIATIIVMAAIYLLFVDANSSMLEGSKSQLTFLMILIIPIASAFIPALSVKSVESRKKKKTNEDVYGEPQ